jgi:UDP-N-acetylmuramate dehydrogenase
MRQIDHFNLKQANTMQIDAYAAHYILLESMDDIEQLPQLLGNNRWMILGGGSNVLFTKDFEGTLVHMAIKGITEVSQDDNRILLDVAAGEDWPSLVNYAVTNDWAGIENLALIPGTMGASPVQNIAAYGQSVADVIESVTYFDLLRKELVTISNKACQFGYRDSIFKHDLKKAIIASVRLSLSRKPKLAVNYYSIGRRRDSIQELLAQKGEPPYTIAQVYEAVVAIRTSKLPNWHSTPTFGSFFKNPLLTKQEANALQAKIENLQLYPADSLTYQQDNDPSFDQAQFVKVPAGRLLDELGWADKKIGHVHTYNRWASIVTHDGLATGKEVFDFTQAMRADVTNNFGIELEAEVNIL